ncbi:NAD-dependent epimerase/dehydratase family protein [Bifidobacterium eulemuris]
MVTGADGYIGQGVVDQLLQRGHDVIAASFGVVVSPHSGLVNYTGDVFEYCFDDAPVPDVLLHLAWRDGFKHNEVSHLEDLSKHYVFIRRALEAGVRHVAVMGSMHEVGYHEGVIDSRTPCNPTTPYGVAKNALRQLTFELCRKYDAKIQWLRGFYLVSSDGRGESIFSKIVRAERENKQEFPFTSGRCKYDFLPYDKFCEYTALTVTQDTVDGIINICSGMPVSLGDYIEKFLIENNFNIRLAYGKYPDRPYDSPCLWGDDTKLKTILDLCGEGHE